MRIRNTRCIILLFCFCSYPLISLAQTLPVGTPVLEDAYRRAQLIGQIDSTVSFTVRPIFPVASFKFQNVFNPNRIQDSGGEIKPEGKIQVRNNKPEFKLLPVTYLQQLNTLHPEGINDGALIPSRGYQNMFSAGFYARLGCLSLQIRPEYVYAENKDFQQFYKEHKDFVWYQYSELFNNIDLPERFGDKPYKKLFWGQSSIRITFDPISLGISNENLWWGPGMRNSLLMSNSASGFKHITLNSVRPVKTPIGSFEGQLISGRLENSGILPPDTSRTYMGNKLFFAKREEWRYINGIVLTYHPRWVQGLFLGLTRSMILYGSDVGSGLKDILPVFYPFSKKDNSGNEVITIAKDQHSSLFFRWLLVNENAEVYGEFGKESTPYNGRDLMLQAEYSRAFIFGFRKLFNLSPKRDQFIQLNAEVTQLEQTNSNPEHLWSYWYSNRYLRQGYTNEGQLLGAGIGPGSNMQTISVSWVKALKSIGVQGERYVHNNDFNNIAVDDIRGNWVDVSVTVFGELDFHNFLLAAKIGCIRSLNYEYMYQPTFEDPTQFWVPGKDIFNFQGQLSLSYRF